MEPTKNQNQINKVAKNITFTYQKSQQQIKCQEQDKISFNLMNFQNQQKFSSLQNDFPENNIKKQVLIEKSQVYEPIPNFREQQNLNLNEISNFEYIIVSQNNSNSQVYNIINNNNLNYIQPQCIIPPTYAKLPIKQFENLSIEKKPSLLQNQDYNLLNCGYHNNNFQHKNSGLRLINNKPQDSQKQVVAVIITINKNDSYDHLFTTIQQKSLQGTRVLVYEASTSYIDNFIKAFQNQPVDDTSKQMMQFINKISPDCVVFNWECCGAYSTQQFVQGKDKVFIFLKIIIDKGHMAMFSDFSLKALINQWNQLLLGPNPFIKTGQTSGCFQIRFKAGQLKQCPSAQLQIVGQMAQQGKCDIIAMGGTICFSVNNDNINHQQYKLQVLSISISTPPKQQKYQLKINNFVGSAAHVLLTYPTGGMILTSMGHWIELMKIDTSDKKLFEIAEKQYGKQYASQMQMEYNNINQNQRSQWVSRNAVNFIQNQAPCSSMAIKSIKSKMFNNQ